MKKTLALIVTAVFFFGALSACNKMADNENTLEIYYTRLGYGDVWLNKLIDIFKDENPGVKVEYWFDDTETGRAAQMLPMGAKHTSTDLILTGERLYKLQYDGSKVLSGYDNVFANISDIYNQKVPGEDILFKDKMVSSVKNFFAVEEEVNGEWEDQWYFSGYGRGNFVGLIYNNTKFQQNNLSLPRTTKELLELSDTIKNTIGENAFSIAKGYGYYESANSTWWAQYEGFDNYKDFWQGKKDGEYSPQIFEQMGRLYALEAENAIVNPDTGYNIKNALTMEYTSSQAKMVNGEAFMQFNGDWFEQEMASIIALSPYGSNLDIRMMQMPIISALSDKLSYWALSGNYQTESKNAASAAILAQYDANLRALIDYVDGITPTKPDYTTDTAKLNADIARVRQARTLSYGTASSQVAAIPAYSNAIPLAKKFIQLMATDRAQRIMAEFGGTTMPFAYDFEADRELWNKLSSFRKSTISVLSKSDEANQLPGNLSTMGAWLLGFTYPFGQYSFFNEASERKTPEQVFNSAKMSRDEFFSRIDSAGLR